MLEEKKNKQKEEENISRRPVVAPSTPTVISATQDKDIIGIGSPSIPPPPIMEGRSQGEEIHLPTFVTCSLPPHLSSSISSVVTCDDFPKVWHDVGEDHGVQTPKCEDETYNAHLQKRINNSILHSQSDLDEDFVNFVTGMRFS